MLLPAISSSTIELLREIRHSQPEALPAAAYSPKRLPQRFHSGEACTPGDVMRVTPRARMRAWETLLLPSCLASSACAPRRIRGIAPAAYVPVTTHGSLF